MEPSYPYPRGNNPEDFCCGRCGTWFTRWRTNGIEYRETLSNLKEIQWRADQPWFKGSGCSVCVSSLELDFMWHEWLDEQPRTIPPESGLTDSHMRRLRAEALSLIRSRDNLRRVPIAVNRWQPWLETVEVDSRIPFDTVLLRVRMYTPEGSRDVHSAVIMEYKDVRWLLAWTGKCPPAIGLAYEENSVQVQHGAGGGKPTEVDRVG